MLNIGVFIYYYKEARKVQIYIEDNITQEELDETQSNTEKNINTVVYVCMGTKEITNILVYLAIAAYVETKIIRAKTENEVVEEKEEVKE